MQRDGIPYLCMQRPILFVPDYSSHYEKLEIKSTNIAANIP